MSEYKEYEILITTVLGELGKVTEVGFSTSKAGVLVFHRVLSGPFNSEKDARAAAAWLRGGGSISRGRKAASGCHGNKRVLWKSRNAGRSGRH